MLTDEIVDEVRTIREAHASKFGYDLRAIYANLKKPKASVLPTATPTFFHHPNCQRQTLHCSGLASLTAELDVEQLESRRSHACIGSEAVRQLTP